MLLRYQLSLKVGNSTVYELLLCLREEFVLVECHPFCLKTNLS